MEIAMFSVTLNIIAVILLVIIVMQLHDLQKNYLHNTTLYLLWSCAKNSWIIRIIRFALSLFKFRIKIEREE